MKISYYMPFKALDHPQPSGDLIIGRGIFSHLIQQHQVDIASTLRCRWIYYKPQLLLRFLYEAVKIKRDIHQHRPDLWLTYHSYYKAPDLLGPIAQRQGIPYVIFQGIYSTKRRKKLKTRLGFALNKRALLQADLIITNKKRDYKNLCRLKSPQDILYLAPGLEPQQFTFQQKARAEIRNKWGIAHDETVILSVAMFRPGVKTEGLKLVIDSARQLLNQQKKIRLVIVGGGQCQKELEEYGADIDQQIIFAGKVTRAELYQYYSAADIFAFPGIHESLGMVYLEAQSCGLPVVAYQDWGASEAVVPTVTGFLSPARDHSQFTAHLALLESDTTLRQKMGQEAQQHIRKNHDIKKNYSTLSKVLQEVVSSHSNTT